MTLRRIGPSIALVTLAFQPLAAADETPTPSEFVGTYNGNSFETASGMRILEDGTFQWYISVGALDMRAQGTWEQNGDTITFASDPKPVPPEFAWSGFSQTPDQPFLSIVNAANGEPFDYASVTVVCANGMMLTEQAQLGIWSPSDDDDCDIPEKVRLRLRVYNVESRAFDLTGPLKPKPGQTLRFEFRANDIGLADFTGVTGRLEDATLTISGPLGDQKLRKVEPQGDE